MNTKKRPEEKPGRMVIACPLGFMEITATDKAVTRVHLTGRKPKGGRAFRSHPLLRESARQLREYFSGKRRVFDLALEIEGTDFERKVWKRLQGVPYGRTASYKDIARGIGRPSAYRAVGAANGKNPLAIVIPCHRIIGRDGRLVGYGGGLWRKKWLLDHEKRHAAFG